MAETRGEQVGFEWAEQGGEKAPGAAPEPMATPATLGLAPPEGLTRARGASCAPSRRRALGRPRRRALPEAQRELGLPPGRGRHAPGPAARRLGPQVYTERGPRLGRVGRCGSGSPPRV